MKNFKTHVNKYYRGPVTSQTQKVVRGWPNGQG